MENNNKEGLTIRHNRRNQWFWLFFVNGIVVVWSMRFFENRFACIVDASNRGLIL